MTSGFQARTSEWRWPVVDLNEPPGVRTILGYVMILERQTEGGAPISYHVMFLDAEARPLPSLAVEDMDVFYDATQAVLVEMGLRAVTANRPVAGDIVR